MPYATLHEVRSEVDGLGNPARGLSLMRGEGTGGRWARHLPGLVGVKEKRSIALPIFLKSNHLIYLFCNCLELP